ncbi:hypothetical protein L1887_60672 [Cichorium endivia]|nr:hypothetical protein L1887_60672 [Cichorium endivia]
MVVTGDGELGFDSGRGSLRNGYHIQGRRRQARKLPNPDTGRLCTGLLVPSVGDALLALIGRGSCLRRCYFEEIRVLKASLRSTESSFLDSMGGGAWPFLVGGAICLVNSVNERDLSLLTSYVEVSLHGQLLRGTMAFQATEV